MTETEQIKALRKPAWAFQPSQTECGTFAGGTPYQSADSATPADREGNPMVLLLQVDLASIDFDHAPHDWLDLPTSGFLQFFLAGYDLYGCDFDGVFAGDGQSGDFVVRYLPDARDVPGETDADAYSPVQPAKRTYLRGRFVTMLPEPGTTDVPDELAQCEQYDDYFYELNDQHFAFHLGGYPHFVQTDVREDVDAERVAGWELLLGSVSDEDGVVMWGDMGSGNFWIKRDALADRDFSHIEYSWDCG